MSLVTKALLVQLNISQWYNRVIDKRVTREVAEKYNVKGSEDQYIKRLIPTSALTKVQSGITELRQYHHDHTLPWSKDGIRILPVAAYNDYLVRMTTLKADFLQHVDAFIQQYPNWIEAAKASKGDLFNPAQYPEAHELREQYNVHIEMLPFPDAADFRIDLAPEDMAHVKAQTTATIENVMAEATKQLLRRLHERAKLLYDAISVPDRIFRDATLSSVLETVEIVASLNIQEDSGVALACAALRTDLDKVEAEALRTVPTYRRGVAERLSSTLNALESLLQ